MIAYVEGNILEADVDAVVNTVNTFGKMGKGLALEFKKRYPDNCRLYEEACANGDVEIGRMFITRPIEMFSGLKFIINFPTKQHWSNPSQLEWIERGLQDLRRVMVLDSINSIAIPPLGCGNGGLNWHDVRPRIEAAMKDLAVYRRVLIYGPAPAAKQKTNLRVVVFGGREYCDKGCVYAALDHLHSTRVVSEVIHGDARGADSLADSWARDRGVKVTPVPAPWGMLAKAAGAVRNRTMCLMGPDAGVQFPGGKGTEDMARKCAQYGIPVWRPVKG